MTSTHVTKRLNLLDSTALVIGSMIGSGVFIVSADIARQLGSPGWLMIVWLITGVLTIIAAISYGELAAMMPHAGGQYVYLREAFNPLTGFLYGWTLFLVIQTGTIAAVAMGFGKFFGVIFPWFSDKHIIADIGFVKINSAQIPAVFSILFLSFINTRGLQQGRIIQNFFTFSKVGILFIFIVLGLILAPSGMFEFNWSEAWSAKTLNSENQSVTITGFALVSTIAVAMVGSLFSSDAWNNVTFTAGEIKNPNRNIPLSLLLGTLIVTIIYLSANIVYLSTLPLSGSLSVEETNIYGRGIQFAANDRVATASMTVLLGNYAGLIMAIFVVISTFGCNNGLVLSGARVYYAMANDGLFFKKISRLNQKQVPASSIWIQGIWASLLCLSGTYGNLLDYVMFSVLLFYVLTISGIFMLRYKYPNIDRPYKSWGYPFLPIVYIIVTLFIMAMLLIYKPLYTFPGLGIVLLGIPVYYISGLHKVKHISKLKS